MALKRMTDTKPSLQKAAVMSRRAWRLLEAFGVSLGGTTSSADLGGSSKYSNENFEGRSGEGFHVNSSCAFSCNR